MREKGARGEERKRRENKSMYIGRVLTFYAKEQHDKLQEKHFGM